MVRYGYGPCETCAKSLYCQMRAHFNINGCLDHVEEIVVNTVSNTSNPSTPVPTKELTPLEQSKEIIRKHCEKQPKPCFLIRDLEDPFSEIETTLKAFEVIGKTWGSRILNDIQDGFVLGSPFTALPPKEDCELLKEALKWIKN